MLYAIPLYPIYLIAPPHSYYACSFQMEKFSVEWDEGCLSCLSGLDSGRLDFPVLDYDTFTFFFLCIYLSACILFLYSTCFDLMDIPRGSFKFIRSIDTDEKKCNI